MRKILLSILLVLVALTTSAQKKEVHILSINDPHAAIEQFPSYPTCGENRALARLCANNLEPAACAALRPLVATRS